MSNTQQIKTNKTSAIEDISALDRFSLDYEYNKTLRDIKRDVRMRTIK